MKHIKVRNKDYIIQFTTEVNNMMCAEGLTAKVIQESVKEFDMSKLARAFYYGLKAKQYNITESEAYQIMDDMYDEGMTAEELMLIVVEELFRSLGFYPMYKKMMEEQKKAKK